MIRQRVDVDIKASFHCLSPIPDSDSLVLRQKQHRLPTELLVTAFIKLAPRDCPLLRLVGELLIKFKIFRSNDKSMQFYRYKKYHAKSS